MPTKCLQLQMFKCAYQKTLNTKYTYFFKCATKAFTKSCASTSLTVTPPNGILLTKRIICTQPNLQQYVELAQGNFMYLP